MSEPGRSNAKRGDDNIDWDEAALEAAKKPEYPASGAGPDCDYFREFVKPHDRVLDLGCNIGSCIGVWRDLGRFPKEVCSSVKVFKTLEPTIIYEGLDWSEVAIKIARERYPDATFYLMDARDMDFNERFDIIFTHTFYQHCNRESKRQIVPRVYKALKNGGLHIIEENTSVSTETCMLPQEYIAFFESFKFKTVKVHDIGSGGTAFIFKKEQKHD